MVNLEVNAGDAILSIPNIDFPNFENSLTIRCLFSFFFFWAKFVGLEHMKTLVSPWERLLVLNDNSWKEYSLDPNRTRLIKDPWKPIAPFKREQDLCNNHSKCYILKQFILLKSRQKYTFDLYILKVFLFWSLCFEKFHFDSCIFQFVFVLVLLVI